MELKSYQKEVLSDLGNFLDHIEEQRSISKAFASYWEEKGVDLSSLRESGHLHAYANTVRGVPNVTVKVPTAGGKTFIACNALKPIFDHFPTGKPRAVAWFVPSDQILQQTLGNLQNPNHPYRQCLDTLFNHRVHVLGKEDALMGQGISPAAVAEQVTIFVLSVSSFAANDKEGRKSYRENENLTEYTKFYDSLTHKVEGADETSLMQVLSYLTPVVIVDESHNFTANLRVELLNAINPFFILNLSATPKTNSNIISFVDAIKLKRANMVKLPVIVYNHRTVSDVIISAINLRRRLEERAAASGGGYIRPIVLFQAQPRTNEDNVTFDRIKEDLLDLNIPEEQIKIKTADRDELKGVNLMSRDCPVRYIITVDALKEGWDCPFAYILASLANRTSRISVEQILGRVLRLPYTARNPDNLLNLSYVFTSSRDFSDTLDEIIRSLNNAGFSRRDYRQEDLSDKADGQNDYNERELPELKERRLVDFDKEYIRERIDGTSADGGVDEIESFAAAQNDSYEAELKRNEDNLIDTPSDLQDAIDMSGMKDIFTEAKDIVLPQFVVKVEETSVFEEKGKLEDLDKVMLEQGFDLSMQDKNIDFTLTESQAEQIDLGKVGTDEYDVHRSRLNSRQLADIRSQFIAMPDENRRNNAARNIAGHIRLDSIPEPQVEAYIREAIANLDSEKIAEILSMEVPYAEKVKQKINGLLKKYRKERFMEKLDTGEIFCVPRYGFPSSSPVRKEVRGFQKGLYRKEGDMNTLEENVIRRVEELDNVLFWHRNPEKKGFCINGFINHFPDFIVVLKSGAIALVETKGDDRDNSDSKDKIALGREWERRAGEKYHYYMVFDKIEVEGALTVARLIDRLEKL